MFISDFAIKRPIITVVTMLTLVVFGLFALFTLDTDEFPDIANPIVNVAIPYPGASPDVVEREVLDPIEEAIAGIAGVDKIQGTAQDGFANVLVFFVFSKNVQEASQDIRDKISAIRGDLPLEMEEPILSRFDPADQPILQVALTSPTLTARELTRLADPGIVRELRSIPGVAQASLVGGVERELTVYIEPEKLLAARIGVGQVVAALQQQNLAAPVGRLEGALDERAIRLRGKLETPEEFGRLVVAERGGQLVRLADVARVVDGSAEQRTLALFDGREAVGLSILKAKGYSTTDVSERVRERTDQARADPARGRHADRGAGRRRARRGVGVDNVQSTLIEGALLTVLRGLPVPELLALDGDHRPGAAGVGAVGVHRGLGVRLHAEHHVAAGPVAGHRHPDRRCHRGAREHRAAHRDGQGPLSGLA
jgi:hydrophobic/amphiphilic exporter-1 (mainly G- bacteria), HAE1 family